MPNLHRTAGLCYYSNVQWNTGSNVQLSPNGLGYLQYRVHVKNRNHGKGAGFYAEPICKVQLVYQSNYLVGYLLPAILHLYCEPGYIRSGYVWRYSNSAIINRSIHKVDACRYKVLPSKIGFYYEPS